jgi:hypothetical protein
MARLSPREERELVHLAQAAQSGILRILQIPQTGLDSQHDSLKAADEFLTRLEALSAEPRHISEKSVPNDRIRTLLEKALIPDEESPTRVLILKDQFQLARQVVSRLLRGTRPTDEDLVACLHFIRDTVATKIIMPPPPSPLRVTV